MQFVHVQSYSITDSVQNMIIGQTYIQEDCGKFELFWAEQRNESEQHVESWYIGDSWSNLEAIYRKRIYDKLLIGFTPDYTIQLYDWLDTNVEHIHLLDYYSEQHYNEQLYEQLVEWRKKTAKEAKLSTFYIATNKVLRYISTFIPHTVEELANIHGIGKNKIEKYGEDWLSITLQFERSTSFPLNWVNSKKAEREYIRWKMMRSLEINLAEQAQMRLEEDIIHQIKQGTELEQLCEYFQMSSYRIMTLLERLRYGQREWIVNWAIEQRKRIPIQLLEQIEKAIAEHGAKYLKPIKMCLSYNEDLYEDEQIYLWIRLTRLASESDY